MARGGAVLTFYVSTYAVRPKRNYLSAHTNPRCHKLLKRKRSEGERPVQLAEVPPGLHYYLPACSRCSPRWMQQDDPPWQFWKWWRTEVQPVQPPLDA